MKIALIQTSAPDVEGYAQTAKRLCGLISEAALGRPDFIMLPECAYPSYMLVEGERLKEALERLDSFREKIAALARKHGVYIVIGLPVKKDGRLYNGCLVFDRGGRLLHETYKSNLWHFDESCFTPGEDFGVFETEFGLCGAMVCADGRIPEIARILRLKGARVIFDVVNLVANAPTSEELENQQHAFMLSQRARENGAFIAVCNKCGVERDAVTYLGRSFVVDPQGSVIAECGSKDEEILFCEIDPEQARGGVLEMRRPRLYGAVTTPTAQLPISRKPGETPPAVYCAFACFEASDAEQYLKKAREYIKNALFCRADLIVLPELETDSPTEAAAEISPLAPPKKTIVMALSHTSGGLKRKQAAVLEHSRPPRYVGCTHLENAENADEIKVIELSSGLNVAFAFEREAMIPEIARVAMLNGADLLIHYGERRDLAALKTRAAENKMFTLTIPRETAQGAVLTGVNGETLCASLKGRDHMACAMIQCTMSRSKLIVPGTCVVNGRIPKLYKEIINEHNQDID